MIIYENFDYIRYVIHYLERLSDVCKNYAGHNCVLTWLLTLFLPIPWKTLYNKSTHVPYLTTFYETEASLTHYISMCWRVYPDNSSTGESFSRKRSEGGIFTVFSLSLILIVDRPNSAIIYSSVCYCT